MELWIRSQDRKKIIKVDEVKMETVKEGNTFIYSHTTDLGTYKTKERALEVLNEIQNKINLINLGHDFGSPMIDLKNPTYIYQMPEK